MSGLSGYDSEAVGFDSVALDNGAEVENTSQTTMYYEQGAGSQTTPSKSCGSNTENVVNKTKNDNYPPTGLNEFLRRVVPAMLEQLDQTEQEDQVYSSDSDVDDEVLTAVMYQEIKFDDKDNAGVGDHVNPSVLALSWSNAGNSIAISFGRRYHDTWCDHNGLLKVFTVKRTENDKFIHNFNISEKSCITALSYHPTIPALLAYGTTSGDLGVCNLQNVNSNYFDPESTLKASGHEHYRVTGFQWADTNLTNTFMTMHVTATKKRRNSSDQVLITSGTNGVVSVWQVNVYTNIFQSIVSYKINNTAKDALDISCFDFLRSYPLKPLEDKHEDGYFVVGSSTGKIFLCDIKKNQNIVENIPIDPVLKEFEECNTCVLDVSFNIQRPGIFAASTMDSELRIYYVKQDAPIKVLCMEDAISCMQWLPNNPYYVVVGLAKVAKRGEIVKIYNVATGQVVAIDGLVACDDAGVTITALDVHQGGNCRIVTGDSDGVVRIWELPTRKLRLVTGELQF